MSPKRRFLKALFGGKPDRVPVGNVVSVITTELMAKADAWFPKAHLEPGLMARLAETGHTILGYDTIMPVFSVTQEAAALGCEIDWGEPEMMPAARNHPFATEASFGLPEGWVKTDSIQIVLEALQQLRRAHGQDVVIVGKAMGPWSLAYHLMGVEEFLISTKIDPARAQRCLDVLKEVTVAFARAQMQAGADIICIADHATGGMISPLVYRDMLLPVHRQIVGRIGCPSVLHCCGNTTDRVRYFAEAGFDCYHLEDKVNFQSAVQDAASRMTFMGNVNNCDVLLAGTTDTVAAACHRALDAGVNILSPECAVPLTTPVQNLRMLVQVADERAKP